MQDIAKTLKIPQKATTDEKTKLLNILIKIVDNIINNPNNVGYQSLNGRRIQKMFKKYPDAIQILLNIGFSEDHINKRFIFNKIHYSKLQLVKTSLLSLLNDNNISSEILQLLNDGFTLDEAKLAIIMSNNNNNNNDNINDDLKQTDQLTCLMSMGFKKKISLSALSMFNNDINLSVQFIIDYHDNKQQSSISQYSHNIDDYDCKNNITKCKMVKILFNEINKYKKCITDDEKKDYDVLSILNAFIHLLTVHDTNYNHFKYIYTLYKSLDTHCSFNTSTCGKIKARYNKNDNNNLSFGEEIFDRIHCHYLHTFDIFKLTDKELNEIKHINIDDQKNNNYNTDITNARLAALKDISNKKKIIFSKTTNSNRFLKKYNKFNTNMGQVVNKQQNRISLNNNFSYSYNFHYWDYGKNSMHQFGGITVQDLYIIPKYSSLKEECINNNIFALALMVWQQKYKEAQKEQNTFHCQVQLKANVAQYMIGYKHHATHPCHRGYIDKEKMKINHLLVVILYCSQDDYQQKFTETYRKLEDDDDLTKIKKRHSNFHHFGKYLRETVEVWGTMYFKGEYKRMYHGINKEMIFTGMKANIYTVLSTTYDRIVAIQFSGDNGLLLELIPHVQLKYFDCRWLSKYSHECELLFIGGLQSMNFINIINTFHCWDFKSYVTSLRIIDTMTRGGYFEYDATICHKILKKKTKNISLLLNSNSYDIPSKIKTLTLSLLEHECNRYLPNKYKKYTNLHQYVDTLLHNICVNKSFIIINWKTMNVDTLVEYFGGYIGYSFLFSLFCHGNYQGINLEFIHMLFPNITHVYVYDLSLIESYFLDDILKFLTNEKSHIIYFELGIAKEFEYSNINEQCLSYKIKFKQIGFHSLVKHNKTFETESLMFRK